MKRQMYKKDVFALRHSRDEHLRWGQAIVNEYFTGPWPELFYETDENKVFNMMWCFFESNQIPYEEDAT